jgi:hypothetical protein
MSSNFTLKNFTLKVTPLSSYPYQLFLNGKLIVVMSKSDITALIYVLNNEVEVLDENF